MNKVTCIIRILYFSGGIRDFVDRILHFVMIILQLTDIILHFITRIQVFTFSTQLELLEMVSFAFANDTISVGSGLSIKNSFWQVARSLLIEHDSALHRWNSGLRGWNSTFRDDNSTTHGINSTLHHENSSIHAFHTI